MLLYSLFTVSSTSSLDMICFCISTDVTILPQNICWISCRFRSKTDVRMTTNSLPTLVTRSTCGALASLFCSPFGHKAIAIAASGLLPNTVITSGIAVFLWIFLSTPK